MPHIKWNGSIFKFCAVLHLEKVIKWNLRYFQFYLLYRLSYQNCRGTNFQRNSLISAVVRGFHASEVIAQFLYVM